MAKFKQACFAHDLSKKLQIFAAVHNSFLGSAAKIFLSNISPNSRANGYRRGDYWSYFIIVDMMSNELPKACDKD